MESKYKDKKHAYMGIQHHDDDDPFTDESTHGNLIALEGDEEVIDIQLRLLPPSSKILLLSSLKDSIPIRSEKFNARTFVRDVHTTFTARSETARAFLLSSTSSQPRLVFMNGGCVGARTTCITRIAEKVTNGNIQAAEGILDRIIKKGVSGLIYEDEEEEQGEAVDGKKKVTEEDVEYPRQLNDPSSVAMRAAENLDRETAELQPELEHKIGGSALIPTMEQVEAQDASESPQVAQESFTNNLGHGIQEKIVVVPNRSTSLNDKRSTFGHRSSYTANTVRTEIFSQDEKTSDSDTDTGDDDDRSSRSEELRSTAPTPAVEFGKACIIDVQSARPSLFGRKRSVSVDQLLEKKPRPDFFRRTPSANNISDKTTTSDGLPRLRTTFLKASEMTIKRSPTISTRSNRSYSSSGQIYVDRGTDPIDFPNQKVVQAVSFEPVFPVIEDFIINLIHGKPNPVVDSVVKSYKSGTYTPLPPPEPRSTPPSPHDSHITLDNSSTKGNDTDDDSRPLQEKMDTSSDNKALPQRHGSKIQNPGTRTAAPLTPANTPPPLKLGVAHKFLSFVTPSTHTPVGIQNAFRALLTTLFPPSSTGFKQYAYASDLDRLWKPVFRFEMSNGKEGRTVDQIIAVGCEEGVRKDFSGEIAGRIEKLGMKQNGLSRSGRLDIGYLIANAMQIYSNPHPSIAPGSPLSNPTYLASLLIPHLESYLAANSTTRLLVLQYPAAYLPTILSLRALLGSEILKIAGIKDANKGISSPPRTPQKESFLTNEGAAALNSRSRSIKSASGAKIRDTFNKADFVLSDLANSQEIDHFFAQIQRSLLERSSFYMPEHPSPSIKPIIPEKSASRKAKDRHTVSSTNSSESSSPYIFSKPAKSSGILGVGVGNGGAVSIASGPDKAIPRTTRNKSRPHSPCRSTRAESTTPSVRRREKAWEDFDMSDEEDFDRQIVSPGRRKGNSRKALKWLGLLT